MQVPAIWLASARPRRYIRPMIDLFRRLAGRSGDEPPAQVDGLGLRCLALGAQGDRLGG